LASCVRASALRFFFPNNVEADMDGGATTAIIASMAAQMSGIVLDAISLRYSRGEIPDVRLIRAQRFLDEIAISDRRASIDSSQMHRIFSNILRLVAETVSPEMAGRDSPKTTESLLIRVELPSAYDGETVTSQLVELCLGLNALHWAYGGNGLDAGNDLAASSEVALSGVRQ
jgi:hypothetical protein